MTEQVVDIRSAVQKEINEQVQKEINEQMKAFMAGQAVIEWAGFTSDKWETADDVKQYLNRLICRPEETFFEVGDIIEDDDGVRAVVIDVDIDSAFWYIDENGCCGVEDNEDRTWRRVSHTNMVGTLINVLKEG